MGAVSFVRGIFDNDAAKTLTVIVPPSGVVGANGADLCLTVVQSTAGKPGRTWRLVIAFVRANGDERQIGADGFDAIRAVGGADLTYGCRARGREGATAFRADGAI